MNRPHYLSSKTSGGYGTRLECECDSGPWVKYKEMVKLRARDELEDKVAFHLGLGHRWYQDSRWTHSKEGNGVRERTV